MKIEAEPGPGGFSRLVINGVDISLGHHHDLNCAMHGCGVSNEIRAKKAEGAEVPTFPTDYEKRRD